MEMNMEAAVAVSKMKTRENKMMLTVKKKLRKGILFKKEKNQKMKMEKKPRILFSIFKIKIKMRNSMGKKKKKSKRKMNRKKVGTQLNGNFYSINLT